MRNPLKAPINSLKVGALWIGGADNYIIEILGNGHKPGLKRIRQYDVGNGDTQEFDTAGNLIVKRNDWAGLYTDEVRQLLCKPSYQTWLKIGKIRNSITTNKIP